MLTFYFVKNVSPLLYKLKKEIWVTLLHVIELTYTSPQSHLFFEENHNDQIYNIRFYL